MIFKGLKHTVLKNKFDTLLAQTEGCRTVPLHKIQSVGIITLEEISSKIDLQKEVGAMISHTSFSWETTNHKRPGKRTAARPQTLAKESRD